VSRVIVIHWNPESRADRTRPLERAGYEVEVRCPTSQEDLRRLAATPPDAFVIDLERSPSHGRDLALWLRQRKGTRGVPLVFVAGQPDKVSRLKALIPDATYTEWPRIRRDLRQAIRTPPAEPVVRPALAGYSGTPLIKKLGIKAGSTLALLGAPVGFEATLGGLPDGVRVRRQARGHFDKILLFARSRAELERRFPVATRALTEGGGLWIAWPKKASGVRSDLGQADVRAFGLARGFVDYKICAIDRTWSGLQFARRRR
jgi:CheY-like chemotaxis protein